MGKFDKYKGVVPSYKQAVADIKDTFKGKPEGELLDDFSELKGEKKKRVEDLKETEKTLTAITEVLVEDMEERELTQLKNSRLGLFSVRTKVYVTVNDKQKLFQWLRDNDYGDLIKEEIHHQTLNELFSEILTNGSLPEDAGVSVFLKSNITNTPIKS